MRAHAELQNQGCLGCSGSFGVDSSYSLKRRLGLRFASFLVEVCFLPKPQP